MAEIRQLAASAVQREEGRRGTEGSCTGGDRLHHQAGSRVFPDVGPRSFEDFGRKGSFFLVFKRQEQTLAALDATSWL